MNRLFTKRPLFKTGIVALLLLPFLFLLNEYSPDPEKAPEGYSSIIVAFEFVSDPSELEEVLGALDQHEIRDIDRLNYVDFGFMTLYGIFMFLFMSRFGQLSNCQVLQKVKFIILVVVLSDVLENLQLLKLTGLYLAGSTDVSSPIAMLKLFTWSKWLLLGLAIACIGYCMSRMKLSQWIGYICFVPFSLGIAALVLDERKLEDVFALSVFFGFFILFIYSLVYKRSSLS